MKSLQFVFPLDNNIGNCMYHANERVEFFQSESSFQSESNLSNSRYYDFTNEIISETQNVFLTLKRQLLPNEQLSQQDRVKYILSRAQIIYKDTIPEHKAYLQKIHAPANATSQVTNCSQRLKKLLQDYQSFKNGTLIYKQFFNLYGREFGYNPDNNFVKGEKVLHVQEQSQPALKPEYIQINYNNDRGKLRATPRMIITSNNNNDKEVNTLRQQIYMLKKNIEDMKKKHDLQLTNERLMVQKRIRTYMKVQSSNDNEFYTLKQELDVYSLKLSEAELQNKNLKIKFEEQGKVIEALKLENVSLREQVQLLRKNDIHMQEQNIHDRSYTSEMGEKEDRRTEKRLKLVLQENELLKNQLKAQRQRMYRLTSDLTEEEKKELQRLKKQSEKKAAQIEQLYNDLDKLRIQILQLNHNLKLSNKIQQSLKKQNEDLKKHVNSSANKQQKVAATHVYPLPSSNQLENSLAVSRKLQVQQYEGEGVQGLPYYEILNKQFKIRFRRACLKEKELLYKANGLEVGVITQFSKPNKIDLLLHLTNYGEHRFDRVKGKIMNANENKITGQTFEYMEIASNDQVKVPISLLINHYPLGPLILLLEYNSDKKEQLRILLPAHIFKMMEFEIRTHDFKNPKKIVISSQRKIAKGVEQLLQYMKAGKIEKGSLKLSAFHRHTHTQVLLQIIQTKEGFQVLYEHYEGNSNITDYFIKTFQFLLKK